MSITKTEHYQIVIVGGGSAGITIASRLIRALKHPDLAVIEPATDHYYQPLWTLIGGGVFKKEASRRAEQAVMPQQAIWIHTSVIEFMPDEQRVLTIDGRYISYDYLIITPGIQLDWHLIKGLDGQLGTGGLCSNYAYDQCERTWETIKAFQGGEALFTQPSTPVKCGGAPQKIMYLADDHFRRAKVRDRTAITFLSGVGSIFSVKEYAATLEQVIARKNIETRFQHDLVEVRPASKEAIFVKKTDGSEVIQKYDLLHITPPMSAPEVVKQSSLSYKAGPLKGWLKVDKQTLQHLEYPAIFGAGDVAGLPTSKTGAAIRKQAPVLVQNILNTMQKDRSSSSTAHYDGYSSCPLITGYGKLVLAEFDYSQKPAETFPFDQTKERFSMYLLKMYGLPLLYWHGMLKGRF